VRALCLGGESVSTAIDLDVTNAEYHADTTIVSNTGKECFRKSQALYHGMYVTRTIPFPPPTPALQMGIAAHVAILEPDKWASEFVCGLTGIDRRTTAGKAEHAAFLEAAGDKTVVPFDDYMLVCEMRRACRENELVRTLLDKPGDVEHSYKWLDDESGLWLKSRPDKTFDGSHNGIDIIADLKTGDFVSPGEFEHSCRSWGYERTAALRIDGHKVRTGNNARYLFIAVSKKTLEVGLYELQPAEIELGRKENRRLLNRMAYCYKSGDWVPEWSKRIVSLAYPAWAFNQEIWEVGDGN
jgi:hypothetical protein